jgi:hypothetical protein
MFVNHLDITSGFRFCLVQFLVRFLLVRVFVLNIGLAKRRICY